MATNRLNGSGSLNYMGVNAPQPPNLITMNRRPTVTDGVGFAIGTLWVIPQKDVGVEPQEETWILVGNRQGIFTWKRFRNSGGPTPPPSSVIINTIVNDVPGTYTYTPTSGMVQVTVELVGGGGGSTSWPAAGGGSIIMGEGGSGASYCKKTFNATTIGASQSFVVGAGGVAGGISDPTGGDGQASTFGSFMSAGGGFGGGNGGPPNPASLNGVQLQEEILIFLVVVGWIFFLIAQLANLKFNHIILEEILQWDLELVVFVLHLEQMQIRVKDMEQEQVEYLLQAMFKDWGLQELVVL
jgi:hypothetical protein